MTFDIHELPWSVCGSYLAVSSLEGFADSENLYIRSVHTKERWMSLYRISLWKGDQQLTYRERAYPGLLALEAEEGERALFTFQNEDALRIRAENCQVRLTMENPADYRFVCAAENGKYELNMYSYKMLFSALAGGIEVTAPWEEIRNKQVVLRINTQEEGTAEAVLEEYESVWDKKEYEGTLEEKAAEWEEKFSAFLKGCPKTPEKYKECREKAAYLNWSCIVHPAGYLKRNAMFMSKNWMTYVWSWDHCFNAMALAKGHPQTAWEQMILPFDLQDASGALPDCVGDQDIIRNFVKPPIHGLVLMWMEENTEILTEQRVAELYPCLCRWTEYWFYYHDQDRDGVPEYRHGNDSGWDNSTIFADGPAVEGTDLCAFLILQMEMLGRMAEKLGMSEEARIWEQRSSRLLQTMMEHFFRAGELLSCESGTHKVSDGKSLQNFLILVLGERLPEEVRKPLLEKLLQESGYRTKWGFATERTDSRYYRSDGYWRGPIWAPAAWLIVQGLKACGYKKEALQVMTDFCDLCRRSGSAENFDAVTGEPLRDRAYTWTASVFLLFANAIWEEEQ